MIEALYNARSSLYCELCEISMNTFSYRPPTVTASVMHKFYLISETRTLRKVFHINTISLALFILILGWASGCEISSTLTVISDCMIVNQINTMKIGLYYSLAKR